MTRDDAMALIGQALAKVTGKTVALGPETDLIEDEILDSLDGMVFAMEIEKAGGVKFPDDVDLVDEGYFKVDRLLALLAG